MCEGVAVSTVTLLSRVSATADLLVSELSGEMVLLNPGDGVYYGLDAVGAHIWHLLEVPCDVGTIVDDVLAHYEIDRTRCEHDVLTFLRELHAHGLVSVLAAGAD